jgi:general secretion pathway protein D
MSVRRALTLARAAGAALCLGAMAAGASARQSGAEEKKDPPAAGGASSASGGAKALDARGRRVVEGPPTVLAFRNVTVEQIVPFIVESTGKVVVPQQDVMSRKVTVLNDSAVPREQALDLVFMALQQAGVAVIENNGIIALRDVAELAKSDLPVISADESSLDRSDLGAMAQKVYSLRNLTAEAVGEMIKDSLPDYAKLTVDKESNQIGLIGNVALLQRVERLLDSLDRPSAAAMLTETFRLRYADAEVIKQNITDLFAGEGPAGQRAAERDRARQGQNQNRQWWGGQQGQPEGSMSSAGLRVSANAQQNSVTVVAEPFILKQIGEQIEQFWDLPLPEEAVVPKIYELKNSDPIKVRDLLTGLFGRADSGTGAARTGVQQQGGQQQGGGTGTSGTSQGVGRLAGQFSFQAIPESGRLVVVSKSPDNLAVIDKIIEDLDRPQTVGLPEIVELKHANSEDLAEQLNTLLSQDGTLAQLRRAESGLNTQNQSSPFASSQTTTNADGTAQTDTASSEVIQFWWQRSRPPTTSRGASNLIGQIRIVPVWRQNAVMVLSPPEYKQSIVNLIGTLDRPGRQVLISAIVAEMSTDDALSLGIRWSSEAIDPTNADNSLSIGATTENTKNNFLDSLFDTSTLGVNADLNVILQALSTKTDFKVLSRPTVFTSDNQEASFFDGQDIPFITESQPNNNGNLLQSFDYRAVGLDLRVRPRITVRRDVDLRVNIELSSIVAGQTLFGGAVVDRRETTTQLIVKDGQTIVVSGIIRNELTDVVRKVPLLGDIPLIGELFKSREKANRATELFIFITPIVIDNTDAAEELNAPYQRWLKEQEKNLGVGDSLTPPTGTGGAERGTKEAVDGESAEPPNGAEGVGSSGE